MSSKRPNLDELVNKNLAKTNEQANREDASVKSILNKFRASPAVAPNQANESPGQTVTRLDNSQVNERSNAPATRPIDNLATEQPGYSNQVTEKPGKSVAQSISSEVDRENLKPAIQKPGYSVTWLLNSQAPHYKILNLIDDEIIPGLTLAEQTVLRRLYRLSYGFNREITQPVSLNKIAEKCNLSVAGVKLAIKSLIAKNLIRLIDNNKYDPKGGNQYQVLPDLDSYSVTRLQYNQANESPGYTETKLLSSHTKDHDHEDLKTKDHDQSAHERETKMIYQSITGNSWKKADQSAYEKIKQISLGIIEQGIRITFTRAATRPGSLAYFVKEILAIANPTPTQRGVRKRAMEQIIARVRELNTGAQLPISEFAARVKAACAREGVLFDNDLFQEIIG